MALITGDPEAVKAYRAQKAKALAKTAPARTAEAQKKAATNTAEAK